MIGIKILILMTPLCIWAGVLSEQVIVKKIQWQAQKKVYRLSLYGKAGVYYSPMSHLKCLRRSIEKGQKVKVSYDSKSLMLKSCM